MSLIPGVLRRDSVTNGIGGLDSTTMNPPTPLEYGRVSGDDADGSDSTVGCWGGTGTNANDLGGL